MDGQKRIALFVDVASLQLSVEHIDNLIMRLESDGEIVCAKFYGAVEKKYSKVGIFAASRGFEITAAIKRKKGTLDPRYMLDVMESVFTHKDIDAVAVVCDPSPDLMYLFQKLQKQNIAVWGMENYGDENLRYVGQVLYFGYSGAAPSIKKTSVKRTPVQRSAPKTAQPQPKSAVEDAELEILRDINRVKRDVDSVDGDTYVVDQLTAILEGFKDLE